VDPAGPAPTTMTSASDVVGSGAAMRLLVNGFTKSG
jgi:hypothetical protein